MSLGNRVLQLFCCYYQWRTEGGLGGSTPSPSSPPPPPHEIPKALQNRAKLNPIVKSVTNWWI